MSDIDPTRDARLDRIEAALDQLFRQNLAIIEGIAQLGQQGNLRLNEMEDAGRDRLDEIEEKLDRLVKGG